MKSLNEFKQFVLDELKDKCNITEDQIGHLDMAEVDLMEDSFQFDFSLSGDDSRYIFWHDYAYNVGSLKKYNKKNEEEVVQSWGNWDEYGLT